MPKILTSPRDLIKHHEGLRLTFYNDTKGIPTIGYGRNLSGRGLSHEEAEYLFANDFAEAMEDVQAIFSKEILQTLSPPRYAVLLDMAFNLGRAKFLGFRKFISAIENSDFRNAAFEIKYSAYPTYTPYFLDHPVRAERLMDMLENDRWPTI